MRTVSVLLCFVAAVYFTSQGVNVRCFALRNRNYVDREKSGQGLHSSADTSIPRKCKLTSKEKLLVAHITNAGKAGRWKETQHLLATYDGLANPIYSAALTAAFRCGAYADGYAVYKSLSRLGINKSEVSYTMGMKLAAKSDQHDEVNSIWLECIKAEMVGHVQFGARLDAAAQIGDIDTAAKLLDSMIDAGESPDVAKFNTAIHACQVSEPPDYRAAQLFFETMLNRSLTPTVITFGNLVKAHRQAPLEKLQLVRAMMEELHTEMDAAFIEQYLQSLLYLPARGWYTIRGIPQRVQALQSLSHDRLVEAAAFIKAAHAQDVKFKGFPRLTEEALKRMPIFLA